MDLPLIGCEPGTVLAFGHPELRVLIAFYDEARRCTGSELIPAGGDRRIVMPGAYFSAQLV